MSLAKFTCCEIFKKLKPNERFSLITFNHNYTIVQKSELVKNIETDTLLKEISKIEAGGGTTLESAY